MITVCRINSVAVNLAARKTLAVFSEISRSRLVSFFRPIRFRLRMMEKTAAANNKKTADNVGCFSFLNFGIDVDVLS